MKIWLPVTDGVHTPDPLGYEEGPNMYQFGLNNPIVNRDATDQGNDYSSLDRGHMEEIKLARESRRFDIGRKIGNEMRARRAEALP